jgi:hypothetical protein
LRALRLGCVLAAGLVSCARPPGAKVAMVGRFVHANLELLQQPQHLVASILAVQLAGYDRHAV